ncbi:hypothetical protein OS189_17765 [Sulfitobacter sp. F26169L]|nr:hypothetical protein [Sulfitobacter sp. F26169L]MCX7568192.1 hypothetical protein [Sulfitobacter sp. F26169L]
MLSFFRLTESFRPFDADGEEMLSEGENEAGANNTYERNQDKNRY